MPTAALAATRVDHVVSLDALPNLLTMLAAPLEQCVPVYAPEWLVTEHAVSMGRQSLDTMGAIGRPSRYSCPECGGVLFEMSQAPPSRFVCHTGHAFSLRSLGSALDLVTDEALWAGLRALQEKEAVLRELAASQSKDDAGKTLACADQLAGLMSAMRALVSSGAPGTLDSHPE